MLITKEQFDAVPRSAKDTVDIKGECECCGGDIELQEVTEYPLCDNPEHQKHFTAYCPKCDAYYKVKKSHYIKRNRE